MQSKYQVGQISWVLLFPTFCVLLFPNRTQGRILKEEGGEDE